VITLTILFALRGRDLLELFLARVEVYVSQRSTLSRQRGRLDDIE
jgi:hypothetical protein